MFNGSKFSQVAPGRTVSIWAYETDDLLEEVVKTGYFKADVLKHGDRIEVNAGDGYASLVVRTPPKAGATAGKTRTAALASWQKTQSG